MENLLEGLKKINKPVIIAISGFGGSGKSTLARVVGQELNAPVVGIDSFQKDGAFNTEFKLWEIMDFERFEKEVLIPFVDKQKTIKYHHYDAASNNFDTMVELHNNGILIVEGVGLFRSELLKYFTYKIWVDVSIEESIERGKNRDRCAYGNPVDELWDSVWKRNDLQYFSLFKPREKADFIINNSKKWSTQ